MLARKEEILYDSISICTFEWSSYETLVLASIFEWFAPDEGEEGIGEGEEDWEGYGEYVIGGLIAIHIDLARWTREDLLTPRVLPSMYDLESVNLKLGDLEPLLLFKLVPFFPKHIWILAAQFLGLNIISPSGDFEITFWAMPYTYYNSTKL
jgi:hypothetical protein